MNTVIGVGKKIPVKTFTENQIISMAVGVSHPYPKSEIPSPYRESIKGFLPA